ncbi:MAG TPA: phosphotransferase [Candidatus Nanoarchaeia archaeon]|nr:phosphotransferase [Candidatus Nanoarchaeia archaeon]
MFDVKNYIMSIKPSVLGLKDISFDLVEKLGGGILNHTYKCVISGKAFVFRARGDYISDVNPVKNEYDFLKKIERLNISPKPYYYGKLGGKDFVLLEFISGKAITEFTDSLIIELARIYAKLHLVKPRGKMGSFYVKRLADINSKYSRIKSNISCSQREMIELVLVNLKCNKMIGERAGIIQGDTHRGNIIISEYGLRLIDFDFVSYDDPALEVAQILSEMGLIGDEKNLFLSEYIRLTNDSNLIERIKVYTPIFYFESLLWCFERQIETKGKEAPEGINPESFVNEARSRLGNLIALGLIDKKFKNYYLIK